MSVLKRWVRTPQLERKRLMEENAALKLQVMKAGLQHNADQALTLSGEVSPLPSAQQLSPHAVPWCAVANSAGCAALPAGCTALQAAAPAFGAFPTRRGGAPVLEVRAALYAPCGCAVSELNPPRRLCSTNSPSCMSFTNSCTESTVCSNPM